MKARGPSSPPQAPRHPVPLSGGMEMECFPTHSITQRNGVGGELPGDYLHEKNSFISSPFCHCHDESQGPKLSPTSTPTSRPPLRGDGDGMLFNALLNPT